ncbi:DUF4185 domain-containing protein [Actinokineospora bangkokensis]|uniref:DUF4185 domain-containing protein n=1 Tax=Actinokineospora bangkokensis TaxID=1193682 RepID=A0A1Q9LD60_9PSEU|nr:DUF4185 domain-containing protein [Actinokineospora bangkokensis]OLR89971.1 hypothetical protein BJP25_03025 [Actinokineospora bangkokensis]
MRSERVATITGHGSRNGCAGRVHATDLGICWASRDRVFIVFGDTYGPAWGGSGAGPRTDPDWRCNVLAVADGDLAFSRVIADGGQVLARDADSEEETVIPCSGIEIGGVHYLHYMSVRNWGARGKWFTNYAGIAHSTDDGETWHKPRRAWWVNRAEHDHPFQMGAFALAGDWLHLLGTPNGRWGDACLARVDPAYLLEPAAYQYWTGSSWAERDPFLARPVLPGPVAELSVRYSPRAGRWLAMHLDEARSVIVLRTAPELTGPWSPGEVVATGAEYPGLYGGFLLPDDGPDIRWTMSQWESYNVSLMRTPL